MLEIVTVLGLLAFVVALSALGSRSRIPGPTLMVLAGLLIGVIPGLPPVALKPDVVFLLILPPILYGAAWNIWLADFRRHWASISLLAFGLVMATALVVAWVAHAVVPGMPWWAAFLLGAIVSPPDAAAATAICHRLGVSRRIVTVLEGESLVNDATGLICFRVATAALVTGQFSLLSASKDLLVAAVGGVAVGLAVGFVVGQLHKRIKDPSVTTALSLLAPYMAYLPAELLHTSGVLATVAAGLYVSYKSPSLFSAPARLAAVSVWQLHVLLLNGLVFVLIGLQLESVIKASSSYSVGTLVWYAGAVIAAVILVRIAWVFPMAYVPRKLFPRLYRDSPMPGWRTLTVVAWTGMRGIVSLAAALSIPLVTASGEPFPFRDLVILLTFAVIFATLVLQSLTLPPIIRALGPAVSDDNEHEEIVARLLAAGAAVEQLDHLAAESAPDPGLETVRAEYHDRINMATAEVRGELAETSRGRAAPQDKARRIALEAERRSIIEQRERGELSEEVFRRIERDLDLAESRLV